MAKLGSPKHHYFRQSQGGSVYTRERLQEYTAELLRVLNVIGLLIVLVPEQARVLGSIIHSDCFTVEEWARLAPSREKH